jgi:hypothetical protein
MMQWACASGRFLHAGIIALFFLKCTHFLLIAEAAARKEIIADLLFRSSA